MTVKEISQDLITLPISLLTNDTRPTHYRVGLCRLKKYCLSSTNSYQAAEHLTGNWRLVNPVFDTEIDRI